MGNFTDHIARKRKLAATLLDDAEHIEKALRAGFTQKILDRMSILSSGASGHIIEFTLNKDPELEKMLEAIGIKLKPKFLSYMGSFFKSGQYKVPSDEKEEPYYDITIDIYTSIPEGCEVVKKKYMAYKYESVCKETGEPIKVS